MGILFMMNNLTCIPDKHVCLFLFFLAGIFIAPISIFAQNKVVSVCEECHGRQTGRGGSPVKLWQQSIHADNGISCHDCHGGDPNDVINAMNPTRGFLGVPQEIAIPVFCGKCHIGIRDDYIKSAHGKALGRGGPTCVSCHTSHSIQSASISLINENVCGKCHNYKQAAEIKNAMAKTDAELLKIDIILGTYKKQGIDTETYEKALFSLKNRYHRLFHEINLKRIEQESKAIRNDLVKIQDFVQKITENQQQRKLSGSIVIGIFLLISLLCYLMRKTFK